MATAVAKTNWWSGGKSPFNLEYGKLMMWYFLMSDAFTFGAFLISYGTIRFSQNYWADPNVVFNAMKAGNAIKKSAKCNGTGFSYMHFRYIDQSF